MREHITSTVHEYEVRMEQVSSDNVDMSTATNYTEYLDAEDGVLHEAFKRSDHFLGSAHSSFESDTNNIQRLKTQQLEPYYLWVEDCYCSSDWLWLTQRCNYATTTTR